MKALAQADLVTLKVSNSSGTLNSAPLLPATVAPEIFAKHGLKLEVQDFRGNAQNTVTSIISNAADIAFVGTAIVNDAVAEGASLKTIAVPTRPMSEIFLSPAAVKKTGVSVDAPLEGRLRALKGLRLSSSGIGGSHYTFLVEMLRPRGMPIADVQLITVNDPIAATQAILYNQIDGSMWTIGALSVVLKDGAGVRWSSMVKDAPALKDIPFISVIARSAWVDKHPDLVEKFRAGLVDAIARLTKDPVNSSKN